MPHLQQHTKIIKILANLF